MRRIDREVTDRTRIDDIIRRAQVCHLAMCYNGQPYVIPLNFGYDGTFIYLHCAQEGAKVDYIKKNNRVSFEFSILQGIRTSDIACKWGCNYESVVGTGTAEFLNTTEDRRTALNHIMSQYGGAALSIPDQSLTQVLALRITITTITGKERK